MTIPGNALEEINRYVEQRMAETNMPGLALGITGREELLQVAAFGYADLASRRPVGPDTMFEIGSIGKSFTNVALMQLRDEGRLDLDAPVSRYLPWFEVQSQHQPITTHHLLTHSSGLVTGTDIGSHGLYEAWALRHSRTATAPGDYFRYSNVGYKVLGFLLEEMDGRSYPEAIQARVLDPLGMQHSHPVIGFETRRRAAVGYRNFYDDRPEHKDHGLVPALWTEYAVGDGCQASTAGDMAIYMRMLLNGGLGPSGRVLSEESFRLMTQRAIATPQWGGAYYGYGLILADVDGHAYLGHGGSSTGFLSGMVLDLDEGIGVVVLINGWVRSYGAIDMAMHIVRLLRTGLHPQGPRRQDVPAVAPASDPEWVSNAGEYAGTYKSATDDLVLTVLQGERLNLNWKGEDVVLQRRGEDTFFVPHPALELFLLEFGREGGRVVEAFHGQDWYVGQGYSGPRSFDHPEEWEGFTGHYRTYNFGLTNFRVVLRKGSLLLVYPGGGHEPLVPLEDGLFRIGGDPRSPETISFDSLASGRALRAVYSGCPYYRTYTP